MADSAACLIIAYGPDERRFGDRLVLQAGEPEIVGRRVPAFGAEGIGDTRISSRHVEIKLDGEEHMILSENDILGIVES